MHALRDFIIVSWFPTGASSGPVSCGTALQASSGPVSCGTALQASSGPVSCGTALQARRSRFRFSKLSYPSVRTMALGSTQSVTAMSSRRYLLEHKEGRCVQLTTLPHSCADFLEILGSSTSWSPKGLSRSVMG